MSTIILSLPQYSQRSSSAIPLYDMFKQIADISLGFAPKWSVVLHSESVEVCAVWLDMAYVTSAVNWAHLHRVFARPGKSVVCE